MGEILQSIILLALALVLAAGCCVRWYKDVCDSFADIYRLRDAPELSDNIDSFTFQPAHIRAMFPSEKSS